MSSASADAGAVPEAEAFARIRLLRSPNIGPATYRALLQRCGNAQAALAALPDLAARGSRAYRAAPEANIAAEIAATRRAGGRYLFHDAADFPALLGEAEGAPPVLIARGEAALAQGPGVAIVGARKASAAALRMAREFAGELAAAGHAVVSGLARGIDTAAHQGALGVAGAGTVAVIASGIDVAYPPENAALQERIAQEGLLLSELPLGTAAAARQFPARNRIIAGLALGTLVVEAAPASGSLITARVAAEFGREVMAVPGSPRDPRSRGCNGLIRDGAILVQDVEDVLELLTGFGGGARMATQPVVRLVRDAVPAPVAAAVVGDGALVDELARLLGAAPVTVDELARETGVDVAALQMALVELELAGRLARHAGGKVSLV